MTDTSRRKSVTARALTFAGFALLLSESAPAANWPGWRGLDGTGVAREAALPLKWSPTENVRWRVELPERGNSSPIVWGDRVFLTQAVGNRRTLMCFERASGKLLWQSGVAYTEREQTQRDNPYCSATPVTDGERVIASFGSAGLYCYDFAGKELWHREFGKMQHMFGNGSSPVLAGDLCVLPFGPDEKARLIAVNKRTGEKAWEVEPPKVDPSEQQQRGGPDGPGGGGGGRGSGLGPRFAQRMLEQADKNSDRAVSSEELRALADAWFDEVDGDKSGKLTRRAFDEDRRNTPPDERRDLRGLKSWTIGPAMFTAADADKDSVLSRAEFQILFAKWFAEWDAVKSGALSQEQIAGGLIAALPSLESADGGERGRGGGGGRGGGASWSTPILIKSGAREELVMAFPNRLAAYDPRTGAPLWLSKGIGGTIYASPVAGEGVLFAMTSGPGGGGAVAVKAGGNGDVSESQRVWALERFKSAIGSGVIHEGHLFTISQDGVASCVDLKEGKIVWDERLRGSGSRGSSWSSMLLADGKIYVPNQSGDVFVVRAAPKFELLATNSVSEATNASLAASDGELFLRTDKSLWCFARAPQK